MKAKGIPFFWAVSTEVIVNETDGPLWGISVGRQPLGQKAGFMVWGLKMELSSILKDRRSIRKYRKDVIPKETLAEVINNAFWAPTGMTLQNWEVVVVGGKTRDRIAAVVSKARPRIEPGLRGFLPDKIVQLSMKFFENFGDAPILILVYVPKIQVSINEAMSNQERYNVERYRYASLLSAAALAQNILILAQEKGLGT